MSREGAGSSVRKTERHKSRACVSMCPVSKCFTYGLQIMMEEPPGDIFLRQRTMLFIAKGKFKYLGAHFKETIILPVITIKGLDV